MARRKIKKNAAGKVKLRYLRAVLLCAILGVCVYFGVNSNKPSQDMKTHITFELSRLYPQAEAILKENNCAIAKITDIIFNATNSTGSATAGGLITYTAEVTGYDSDKNPVTQTVRFVTIEESNEYKHLRQNTVVIFETDQASRTVDVNVSLGEAKASYSYNVIKQDNSNANLAILVNKYATISREYEPNRLTQSDYLYYTNGRSNSVSYMVEEASNQLEALVSAAEEAGYTIYACSGYRDYDVQEYLYSRAVASLGEDQNDTAKPGTSEHQTGLVMDMIFPQAVYALSEEQENSATYEWMLENAHKYGFILRYPKGAEDLTGYMFEPWHWRYIGVELATEYHESGMETLDEFMSVPRSASFK